MPQPEDRLPPSSRHPGPDVGAKCLESDGVLRERPVTAAPVSSFPSPILLLPWLLSPPGERPSRAPCHGRGRGRGRGCSEPSDLALSDLTGLISVPASTLHSKTSPLRDVSWKEFYHLEGGDTLGAGLEGRLWLVPTVAQVKSLPGTDVLDLNPNFISATTEDATPQPSHAGGCWHSG